MSPEGLPARILELAEELRREGVAVGTSELLDAFAVLGEISWTSQEDFREALAATLAKSQEDRRIFELVFERFFFRATEIAAAREGITEQDAASLAELSDEELDALRAQIAAALRDGAEGAMRDLARMAIAAFARRQEGSGVIGVDVQRIPISRRAIRAGTGCRARPCAASRRCCAGSSSARRSSAPAICPPRVRWASSIALCRRVRSPTSQPCTGSSHSCVAGLPRRGCRHADTAATPTSTCAARCAPRCRPAACRSCSSSARAGRGARRSTCCATSPRA